MGETDASRRGEEIVMASLINNIRYGLRQIRRSPGFAATVILTMALGVGANVIVFSVLNALGRPMQLLVLGSLGGLLVGGLSSKVLVSIVYQATPRDPLVLVGVLVSMSSIGLVAAWIPARRALAVEPSMLLREE
jgi:hypothetical protein